MIGDPHQPTRRQAFLFLLLTIALAGGVFAWVFFINKGDVEVTGDFPFTVDAAGQGMTCSKSPCVLTVKPGEYTVSLKKDGYFESTEHVSIRRGNRSLITAKFIFIPVVHDAGELILPTGVPNAPLQKPFIGMKSLPVFPKNVKESWFSSSGQQALVAIGREFFVYAQAAAGTVADPTTTQISLPAGAVEGSVPAWAGENLVFLENKDGRQLLQKILTEKLGQKNDTETIVSFERPLENPTIMSSPNGRFILIREISKDGVASSYIVGTQEQTRKNNSLLAKIENPHFTNSYLIFEESKDAVKSVHALKLGGEEILDLPAVDSENMLELSGEDALLFLSKENLESGNSGLSITDALNQAKTETQNALGGTPTTNSAANPGATGASSAPATSKKTLFITRYSLKDKSYKTLTSIDVAAGEEIHRLNLDTDGKTFYFEKGGHLFELMLEPPTV